MTSFDVELQDIMNKSALALMLSIGHRTSLFDVITKLRDGSFNFATSMQFIPVMA